MRNKLNILWFVGFELEQLSQKGSDDFHELINVNFFEVILGESFWHQGTHKEVNLSSMFIRCRENEEGLLRVSNRGLVVFGNISIIILILSKQKNTSFGSFLKNVDLLCHIFYMLHNKIHWNPVIPVTRNNDICVGNGWVYKVSKCIFDKFVVLFQNANNRSSSFRNIPFDSPAESNVIYIILKVPSQLMKIL